MNYDDDNHFPDYNSDNEMDGNEVGSYMLLSPPVERHMYELNEEYTYEPNEYSGNTTGTNRKNLDEYKMIDKGFRKTTIINNGQRLDIEYYLTSNTPGSLARDGMTGGRFDVRVGSNDEHLLFKVGCAIGTPDNDLTFLFYNSPEDYEKHMFHPVSPEHKEAWKNKRAIAMKLRDEKRAAARPGFVTVR
jgi:hypothetical protein